MEKGQNYCTVTIIGGLGNKLFRIATLLATSWRTQRTPVLLSVLVEINHQTTVPYDYFCRNILKLKNVENVPPVTLIQESENLYIDIREAVRNVQSSLVVLDGYFQSEKYFMDYAPYIHHQFHCPLEKRLEFWNRFPLIQESVFFHVRRGDYVNHEHHFVDLTTYYHRCIQRCKKETENLSLFVFSDDPVYCQENLWRLIGVESEEERSKINVHIVEKMDEVESLWLMSCCGQGGICSNSSFSWWGGWLCRHWYGDKATIYYPTQQFALPEIKTPDLVSSPFVPCSVI